MSWEDCPKCGYPTKQRSKGLYQVGKPCPECKYNAFGVEPGVSDLGRHRRMTEKAKKDIEHAFLQILENMGGAPAHDTVRALAKMAIGYLELPEHSIDSLYERPTTPKLDLEMSLFGPSAGRRRCKK